MRTNQDLIRYARQFFIPLVDVVSKDMLKNITPQNQSGYIINMSDSIDAKGNLLFGTHWVAIYIRGGKAVYFDPFGIIPDVRIQKWLCPFVPYPYSLMEIQNITSGICGDFCLFFVYYMSRVSSRTNLKNSLQHFQSLFNKDPTKNKTILEHLLKKHRLWSL